MEQHIQTVNQPLNKVVDIYFSDGKLDIIRFWDYPTGRTEIFEVRNPRSDEKAIKKQTFENAIAILCTGRTTTELDALIGYLENDEEYLNIAKKVMLRELSNMASQISHITSVIRKIV